VGYLGSILVGIAFGAGWTPCIGPILGSILIYTSSSADLPHGLALLASYSLGLAIPFLLSAIAVERFFALFQRIRRQVAWLSRVTGVLMVAIGVLMVTNYLTILSSYLQALTPDALLERL
jgi:cytochrome c-type biogenesis protein